MEFTYLCKWYADATTESWTGTICPLIPFDCTEYEITSHESCFHLIIGEHCYSNYIIYIPTWNIAMDISCMEDRFWNQEQLTRNYPELSPVDVISIVEALAAIKKHSC